MKENKKANIGSGDSLRFTDYILFGLSGWEYIRVLTKVMPYVRKLWIIETF